MGLILCPYCAVYDETVFEAVGTCQCGADLRARIAKQKRGIFRRSDSFIGHQVERDYSTAKVERIGDAVAHEASDVLDYARALVAVAAATLQWTHQDFTDCYVLGFLTGSADLTWLLRRRYAFDLADRFRLVSGLRHGAPQQAKAELEAQLTEWRTAGMRRLVIIDEVISGTQMRTGLAAVSDWAVQAGIAGSLDVFAIGVRDAEAEAKATDAAVRLEILRPTKRIAIRLAKLTLEFVTVRKLLAKDTVGRPLKGVWSGVGKAYSADRIWPGGYTVRCSKRLHAEGCVDLDVIWSAASLDQIFGELVWAACGFRERQVPTWPETIVTRGCSECQGRLNELRALVAALPPPKAPEPQEPRIVRQLGPARFPIRGA